MVIRQTPEIEEDSMTDGKKPCCAAAAMAQVQYLVIGGHRIAISNLDEILLEAGTDQLKDEGACRQELLRLVKIHNYVPPDAEKAYGEALFSELRRRRGLSHG
jgi:hypothetical protein